MQEPAPRWLALAEDPPARAIGRTRHVVIARDGAVIPPAGLDALRTTEQHQLAPHMAQRAHMAGRIAQGLEQLRLLEQAERPCCTGRPGGKSLRRHAAMPGVTDGGELR